MIYALLLMPLAARTPGVTWPHKRPLSWWIDHLYPGERWRPIRLGERAVGWRLSEIDDWLDTRKRASFGREG